ncbi:S9 family peptidase [Phenylobacterium deserti]|uniref:Peptidase S9 prolyl oligopeptidase catalytic domain-containing protein n=1 Tax=Phenylobacterium deserti TaxID=1914756 RepID=A0A328ADM3_9CAUL|nr:prolyl oligopeptidase family serine peptidase [Phenylobacterium deserti]RAK52759.1 hypothetical protein DJ018_11260 [Phenylobacterium deserti]
MRPQLFRRAQRARSLRPARAPAAAPRRLTGALLAAGLLTALAAGPAVARPFTVGDLLSLQTLGDAAVDPAGRWLVFEVRDPYQAAPAFDCELQIELSLNRLWRVDLAAPGPARPLLPDRGVSLGPASPDGRRLAVFRLQGGRWELGVVTLADGAVRWLGVTPDRAFIGRSIQWRSSDELVALIRPDGDLPRPLRAGCVAPRLAPALWRAQAEGRASRAVVGSGAMLGADAGPTDLRVLWRLNLRTGAEQRTPVGEAYDLELSPDGRWAAVLADGAPVGLTAEQPLHGVWGITARQRVLKLVDLRSGAVQAPAEGWDLLETLLTWSPSGRQLLLYGRRPGTPWTAGAFLQVRPGGGLARVLPTAGAPARLNLRPEAVSAGWLGETPVARLQPSGDAAAPWMRLQPTGPRPLLPDLDEIPERLLVTPDGRLTLAVGPNGTWRRDRTGRWRPAIGERPDPIARRFDADRLSFATVTRAPDAAAQLASTLEAPRDAVVLARTSAGADSRIVYAVRDAHGVLRLQQAGPQGAPATLLTLNAALADVEPAAATRIEHRGADGRPFVSWLYQPPRSARRPGPPPPLVVLPYPRVNPISAPTPDGLPGLLYLPPNGQLLAAQGLAVLVPALSYKPGEPAAGLADGILAAVDAAAARPELAGAFDPDRLVLWGHSFGGSASLIAASQSPRFRAVVASAPITDLISFYGTFQPSWRHTPELEVAVTRPAGWVEAAQPALRAPPWAALDLYRRSSPVLLADRIHTPVLLLHGDQDAISLSQSEEMFSALFRQGRTARLVTYWGEAHVIRSPGNVEDVYAQVLDWIRRWTAWPPASEALSRDAGPSPAPTAPPSAPPSSPALQR